MLLTEIDLSIDLTGPYNAGGDGVVIWGYTGDNDGISVQGGPQLQRYLDYVKTETGPLVHAFIQRISDCATLHCSGSARPCAHTCPELCACG